MTKDQDRDELHRTIWQIANDLRGSVDGWDFKSYVLGMLFYRFISENLTSFINEGERRAGNPDFDYVEHFDEEAEFGRSETVKEKGFYILPSDILRMCARTPKTIQLNETLSRVFKNIEILPKVCRAKRTLKAYSMILMSTAINSDLRLPRETKAGEDH
jgi:type I restriction enzyme M protein